MSLIRKCCAVSCDKTAEYEIQTIPGGPDLYSDTIDSCTEHVGLLLGTQPEAINPENNYWEVRTLYEG